MPENTIEALLSYLFPTSTYAENVREYATFIEDENVDDIAGEKLPTKYVRWIIECFIDTIKEIRESIIEHPQLRLIGSSLLFIYEGDCEAAHQTWKHMLQEDAVPEKEEEEEDKDELAPKMCDLRLIDFAHSDWHAKREQQDPQLVKGFDNVISFLEECLKRQHQEDL